MATQFEVPQFIDRESKLIGPFTLKQSGILGAAGGILFMMWFFLAPWLFFMVGIPFLAVAAALAFLRIGGRPMPDVLGAFFSFFISPQLYIWQKRIERQAAKKKKVPASEVYEGTETSVSKKEIMELAKRIDTRS